MKINNQRLVLKKKKNNTQVKKPLTKRKLFEQNSPKRKKNKKNSILSDTEDDTNCLYCSHSYLESNEIWICCQKCTQWAHLSCSGKEENIDQTFICENCY